MNIVILGPPGSGKSTQARLLAQHLNIPHVSVGKILKNIVVNPNHPFHTKVKEDYIKGDLVDYDLVDFIVYTSVDVALPQGGVVFDGMPRVMEQSETLDEALGIHDQKLNLAIFVDTKLEESKKRILSREKKEHRPDSKPEIIEERFKVYRKDTLPVLKDYKEREVLKKVDGNLSIEQIYEQIRKLLKD